MAEHSILSPSSAARRVVCPGSRAMEAKYPREETDASREGTLAHAVAASVLLADGTSYPDATDEMWDGAVLYAETINSERAAQGLPILHVEERLDISTIHPACFGTPDAWFAVGSTIYLYDYKFGHGAIEVFENWQLIEYAAGIIGELRWKDTYRVVFTIVQPRSYHPDGAVRVWSCKDTYLKPLFDKLRNAEEQATQDIAITRVSPECNYCAARHACPALQSASLRSTDLVFLGVPFNLNATQVGNELRWLHRAQEVLKARIAGLESEATAMIRRGDPLPHYTLESTQGRQCWTHDAETVVAIGELYGVDIRKPIDVKTPTQAIKAGLPRAVVSQYSERPNGALKLIPTATLTKKVFSND